MTATQSKDILQYLAEILGDNFYLSGQCILHSPIITTIQDNLRKETPRAIFELSIRVDKKRESFFLVSNDPAADLYNKYPDTVSKDGKTIFLSIKRNRLLLISPDLIERFGKEHLLQLFKENPRNVLVRYMGQNTENPNRTLQALSEESIVSKSVNSIFEFTCTVPHTLSTIGEFTLCARN